RLAVTSLPPGQARSWRRERVGIPRRRLQPQTRPRSLARRFLWYQDVDDDDQLQLSVSPCRIFSPIFPSWSGVFVSISMAASMLAGRIPSGIVNPRFSSSCFVEELTPSGQTILVEIPGESVFSNVCGPHEAGVELGAA